MLLSSSSCCCFTPFFFLIVPLISNSLFSFLVLHILFHFVYFHPFWHICPSTIHLLVSLLFFPICSLFIFSPVFAASFKCNICILLWNAKQYHSSNNFIQTHFSLWLSFLVASVQIIHRFCSILFKCHQDSTRNSCVILRFQKANLKGIKCFTRK